MAQDMGALAPEAGHGFADSEIRASGVGVDVTSVGDFGQGGRGDQMDLGVGKGFEGLRVSQLASCDFLLFEPEGSNHRHAQFLSQRIHPCVFQQLRSTVVDLGRLGIWFE